MGFKAHTAVVYHSVCLIFNEAHFTGAYFIFYINTATHTYAHCCAPHSYGFVDSIVCGDSGAGSD